MIVTSENIDTLRGKAGIYQWKSPTGYVYIGSSHNLFGRLKRHEDESHNPHLRNSIAKYGAGAHEVSILEFIDIEDLTKYAARKAILSAEQRWIDGGFARYGDKMMNVSPTACSPLGVKRTDAQRQRNSEAIRKYFENPEALARQSAAIRKYYEDPEARAKTSAANRKRFEDPEARASMSTAIRKVYEDPEARAKVSGAKQSAAIAAATGGNVHVEGHGDFSSVHYAFEQLGIYARGNTNNQHKTFRAALKKAGALTYTEKNGTAWNFSIVQNEECAR